MVFAPQVFLERLAALVPTPRVHLIPPGVTRSFPVRTVPRSVVIRAQRASPTHPAVPGPRWAAEEFDGTRGVPFSAEADANTQLVLISPLPGAAEEPDENNCAGLWHDFRGTVDSTRRLWSVESWRAAIEYLGGLEIHVFKAARNRRTRVWILNLS